MPPSAHGSISLNGMVAEVSLRGKYRAVPERSAESSDAVFGYAPPGEALSNSSRISPYTNIALVRFKRLMKGNLSLSSAITDRTPSAPERPLAGILTCSSYRSACFWRMPHARTSGSDWEVLGHKIHIGRRTPAGLA